VPDGRVTSAAWFEPRSDHWSGPFLDRLASLAAATRFGTAWLVVRRTGLAGAVVLGSDPVARDLIESAASPWPARVTPVGPAAFGSPSPLDGLAALARPGWGWRTTEAGVPAPDRAAPDRDRVPPELSVPPGGRQCHWFSTGTGRLAVRVRVWARAQPTAAPGSLARLALDGIETFRHAGVPAELRELRNTTGRREAWRTGRVGSFASGPLERLLPAVAARLALGSSPPVRLDDSAVGRHIVAVGASGAGKTSFLADLAAARIGRGGAVLAIDLHGDLAPAIVARLAPAIRTSVVAVDAAGPLDQVQGVRLLGGRNQTAEDPGPAHLVAALKRLTSDSGDVYWGFRLERTLEAFVRLAHEEGGGLLDVYELLTDARRRDAARLTTRDRALANFLDEIPTLLRRNPEYLAPATARVAKVALAPRIARLLDPAGPGLPVESLVGRGRSILWRIPFAQLGPEAASFAATLLVAHAYFGLAALGPGRPDELRVALIVDEASALSPRLLAEILSEGRKFGVGAVVATQYPGRLAPEARAAAEGAAGTHVVFRVPPPVAAATAAWAGLDRSAEAWLPALPDGTAVAVRSGDSGSRGAIQVARGPPDDPAAWEEVCEASALAAAESDGEPGDVPRTVSDAVMFSLAAGLGDAGTLAARVVGVLGEPVEPAVVNESLVRLGRRGWVTNIDGRFDLTDAGARYLGVGAPTGAIREGAEHRALLYHAFGILARRGARLELVRQGRFDRRLPDAVVRLLPPGVGHRGPAELARAVDAARSTWAWRYFGGRDVDVEAEVSGALRPDRVRRNLAKASDQGHFALFLVADPARARRIRTVLAEAAAGIGTAQVWTLVRARAASPSAGEGTDGSGGAVRGGGPPPSP